MTENSIQILPIDKVKINPKNPRTITDEAFKKLVKSIKDFPDMLNKRPIIVNDKMIILGGNKRYEAAVEAGLEEIPVIVTNWNKKQQQEFLIKDNTSFGEWDFNILQENWDTELLDDWGIDMPFDNKVDYSILEQEGVELDVTRMTSNVMKAIQIEFLPEDYEVARNCISALRLKKVYVGGMILKNLKKAAK